jgi:hypothetical protein
LCFITYMGHLHLGSLVQLHPIPCTHIMKMTNEIDETMITVQHQKVYLVHFGLPDLQLSDQLMKAASMQILHEDLGMPILIACLENALHPKISI